MFTDSDVIHLIKVSYMDLSEQKNHQAYTRDVNELIRKRARIFDMPVPAEGCGWISARGFAENARHIAVNPRLNKLVLIGHINDNIMEGNLHGSGLVACALKDGQADKIIILCRGSEGGIFDLVPNWIEKIKQRRFTEVLRSEDWRDNFDMIARDSRAFAPLIRFVEGIRNAHGTRNTAYYAYGHSKGGGLAVFLAASYADFGGMAVNGSGLSPVTFIENCYFARRLRESEFVNKITDNDIVGKLLIHRENTVKVRMYEEFETDKGEKLRPYEFYACASAHYPTAMFLDRQGMSVPSRRFCLLPRIIAIINHVLMMKVLLFALGMERHSAHAKTVAEYEEKCINMLQRIVY